MINRFNILYKQVNKLIYSGELSLKEFIELFDEFKNTDVTIHGNLIYSNYAFNTVITARNVLIRKFMKDATKKYLSEHVYIGTRKATKLKTLVIKHNLISEKVLIEMQKIILSKI